jgi:hypothetical protein
MEWTVQFVVEVQEVLRPEALGVFAARTYQVGDPEQHRLDEWRIGDKLRVIFDDLCATQAFCLSRRS